LIAGPVGYQLQFLQFYLTTTIVTIMPVAAGMHGRAKLDREMRVSEARYRMLAEHSTDVVLHISHDGRINYVSPAITRINGRQPAELVGEVGWSLVVPDDREHVVAHHHKVIAAAGEIVTFEYRTPIANGEHRWLEARARLIVGDDGNAEGVVSMLRDISARKETEQRLSQEAYSDPLTGLANRRGFEFAIKQSLATRAVGATDCLALFDIDHFKRVNDEHGHDVGDAVLHMLGRLMQSSVRACDTVARMGGEEFAVHLPNCSMSEALAICERIRVDTAKQTVMAGKSVVRVTISGGVTLFDHDHLPRALKQADQALYVAKRGGRDQLALAA
jgi:diguanylate cyclase (GGDEF)-like protein/PAS domain S-box-containing protein